MDKIKFKVVVIGCDYSIFYSFENKTDHKYFLFIYSSRNFTLADVTINSASGNGRAALDIGVNKPGSSDPVAKTVVQNALREPLQIRNFNLTLAQSSSTPEIVDNTVTVKLINFNASKVCLYLLFSHIP